MVKFVCRQNQRLNGLPTNCSSDTIANCIIVAEMAASPTLPCPLISSSGQINQCFSGTVNPPESGMCGRSGRASPFTVKAFVENSTRSPATASTGPQPKPARTQTAPP